MQISNLLHYEGVFAAKKIEYIRYALRLGEDVFEKRKIPEEKADKLIKLMEAFKLLFDVYDVDDYMICATSAMREAINVDDITSQVYERTGFEITIIDGEREAELINNVILDYLDNKDQIHIDVGGGSTELNFYSKKKKIYTQSFKLGSVRALFQGNTPEEWDSMKAWLQNNITSDYNKIISVGTGGNISKLFDIIKSKKNQAVTLDNLISIKEKIEKYTIEERINYLLLNPDRADVIVPAAEIYINVMKWVNSDKIIVPDIGLKDGIIKELIDKYKRA